MQESNKKQVLFYLEEKDFYQFKSLVTQQRTTLTAKLEGWVKAYLVKNGLSSEDGDIRAWPDGVVVVKEREVDPTSDSPLDNSPGLVFTRQETQNVAQNGSEVVSPASEPVKDERKEKIDGLKQVMEDASSKKDLEHNPNGRFPGRCQQCAVKSLITPTELIEDYERVTKNLCPACITKGRKAGVVE